MARLEVEDIHQALGYASWAMEEAALFSWNRCPSMKFLLNMNTPREVGLRLANHNHSCRHVADIGLAKASDTAIMNKLIARVK